jgi:hypothetical protein
MSGTCTCSLTEHGAAVRLARLDEIQSRCMAIAPGKLILSGLVALVVCVGLGFAWGVSGRRDLTAALGDARQQLDLAEARGEILDGRVSLYNNNFGDASRHFENAKAPLRRLKERYQQDGKRDATAAIDAAVGIVDDAQRMTGKLDPTANSKATEALEAIRVATASK